MDELIIATKNAGKAKEFQQFFAQLHIRVKSLLDFDDLPDVEETGTTFAENARIKAETIAELLDMPVLADDSGLEIDALQGRPGIYSARYAGEDKDDEANIRKVLEEMQSVPMENRTARFVCVLALAEKGKETVITEGYCEGKIALHPAGENGFGYDPIFIPEGYTNTLAELNPSVKQEISHRRHAMDQLQALLQQSKD
ncbi:MAG TPA: XTP/dITP diphosphatase [Bacillota bacterium]|nr:XTP/dITP diphosphatase [Bacillota bacterium]